MNKIFNSTLDLVFPENIYCSCCGDVMNSSRVHGICDSCIKKINWIEGNPKAKDVSGFFFDEVMSLAIYDYNLQNIVMDMKFHGKPYIAKGIGRLMGELFLSSHEGDYLFTCVPMHRSKEKIRGYNQAALLGEYAALYSGHEYDCLLTKVKPTASMRLARSEGRRNALDGSIIANPLKAGKIEDRDIVLVDDVITTGNTADYCSKILKYEGARKVIVLTFGASNYKGK